MARCITGALHILAMFWCYFQMAVLLGGCTEKSLRGSPVDDCEANGTCEEGISGGDSPSESRQCGVLGGVGVCESVENFQSTATREWIIQMPDDWSTSKLAQYGQGSPGVVMWRGKPSDQGVSAIIYRGTKAELGQCLVDHPGALFVEETIAVTADGPLAEALHAF